MTVTTFRVDGPISDFSGKFQKVCYGHLRQCRRGMLLMINMFWPNTRGAT